MANSFPGLRVRSPASTGGPWRCVAPLLNLDDEAAGEKRAALRTRKPEHSASRADLNERGTKKSRRWRTIVGDC